MHLVIADSPSSHTLTSIIANMLLGSNVLLLSTGFLISLTWPFYSSHHRWEKERNQFGNELPSRVKLCVVGSFFTMLLSPALACIPLLTICWLLWHGAFSSYTSMMPLILSWVWINSTAIIPVLYLSQRRKFHEQSGSLEEYALMQEEAEDCDAYETLDETDGPTFLPQHPPMAYYDIFGGPLDEETKMASTITPDALWKNTIEPPEAFRELVRWAVSVSGESLPPAVALELLSIGAISIGVRPDGTGRWNLE
jgi:hypothetical protein